MLRGRDIRAVATLAEAAATAATVGRRTTLSIGDVAAEVPAFVVLRVSELLEDLREGREVAIAPSDLAIGTESAAAVLGVSRPWVARLMDRGDLPMSKSGSKRRVALGDLVAFRRADDRRRRESLTWDGLVDE